MQRSSESIARLATALAKAQAELSNPEKSLVATIRPNGPGIMRDSGGRTLALRSDDGRTVVEICPSLLAAGHDPRTPLELGETVAASQRDPLCFLRLPLAQPHPGAAAVFVDELNAGSLQHTRDCRERRDVACVPPGFDVGYRIAMEAGGLREVSDGPV
jgi:hypothetical protein